MLSDNKKLKPTSFFSSAVLHPLKFAFISRAFSSIIYLHIFNETMLFSISFLRQTEKKPKRIIKILFGFANSSIVCNIVPKYSNGYEFKVGIVN